ncbi:hypothetical protein CH76_00100 [Lysinibacillus sp. BF-4]|uniref:YggS family pyridoxal phosphate-dependent enzyme n=1 Tax=Lysinibacillus sp. BF-4 TaxID=1473546 RepID=UPI0005023CC7|nr:YggS family pyridoxal phosphate-dependent enzyme [Lysinibacillus sp. BF-4]KFL44248.1 hypothetical protein CH76_00100 [Lysinibacillus sp. BF-4]
MTKIVDNLKQINQQVADAKRVSQFQQDVTVIAVTKAVSLARTQEALEAGILDLGENRPEGLVAKQQEITGATWHYIGTLQTRKVRQVINSIHYLHSLDRLSLATEINKRAEQRVKCFVQVNVSGEDSKHGLAAAEAIDFIESLATMDKIEVVGLMTMAPLDADEQQIRTVFRDLKQLQQQVAALQLPFAPCKELSMGMSNDYTIAIEEGATYVRIGTALVGNESEEAK